VISSHAGSTRLPNLSVTAQHLRLHIHSQGKGIAGTGRPYNGSICNEPLPRSAKATLANRPQWPPSTRITPGKPAPGRAQRSRDPDRRQHACFQGRRSSLAATNRVKSSSNKVETRFSFQRASCSVQHIAQIPIANRDVIHASNSFVTARGRKPARATTDRSAGFRGLRKFARFTPSASAEESTHG
jgi:hypothetical protein